MASASVRRRRMSRTSSSRGMPTRSSFGESSFPVSASPAELNPTLIHGPIPIVNETGSPGTRHSSAMSSSSDSGPRSLLCATQTWPSGVAGGVATRSEQREAGAGSSTAISSIEAANTASGSAPAPSATPSSSATSQGSSAAVTSR